MIQIELVQLLHNIFVPVLVMDESDHSNDNGAEQRYKAER